jgi:hypothetical protein
VSLLDLSFICLCQFLLLKAYAFLCRILGRVHHPTGGHLTQGCGEVGGPPYPQQVAVGREAKEAGLERRLVGHEGTGGGISL